MLDAPPEPTAPREAATLTREERAAREKRVAHENRKRELLQRRKAAGYGAPGAPTNIITK